jgi:hypothetical protein
MSELGHRAGLTLCLPLTVYPDQRRSSDRLGWSGSCQERSFKEVESELACRALSPVSASEVIDDGPTRNAPSDADCRAPAMHRNPRVAHPRPKV